MKLYYSLLIGLFVVCILNLFFTFNYRTKYLNSVNITSSYKAKSSSDSVLIDHLLFGMTWEKPFESNLNDSIKNKIILRIPPDACLSCCQDIFLMLKEFDSTYIDNLVIVTSYTNDRDIKMLQYHISNYKIYNFPELFFSINVEHSKFPYLLISSNKVFKSPFTTNTYFYLTKNYLKWAKFNLKDTSYTHVHF